MALLSILCSWHKWGDVIWLPSLASECQSKSCLITVIDPSVGRWAEGLICVRLSKQSSDWQAIQLSGSEKERKTIITSIISHSSTFCCQTLSLLSKWALNFCWISLISYDGPAPTWKTNAPPPPPADFKGATAGSEHSTEHCEDARALKQISLAAPYDAWIH